jgi:hypothetical protein
MTRLGLTVPPLAVYWKCLSNSLPTVLPSVRGAGAGAAAVLLLDRLQPSSIHARLKEDAAAAKERLVNMVKAPDL